MWEAFLLQMNEFDAFLEMELRHMLDPVVDTTAPSRRLRKRTRRPILAIEARIELAPEAIPIVEPVVVVLPAAAPQL